LDALPISVGDLPKGDHGLCRCPVLPWGNPSQYQYARWGEGYTWIMEFFQDSFRCPLWGVCAIGGAMCSLSCYGWVCVPCPVCPYLQFAGCFAPANSRGAGGRSDFQRIARK